MSIYARNDTTRSSNQCICAQHTQTARKKTTMVADDDFRGRNFEKTDGGGAGKILCELTDDSNYLADR